MTASRTIQTLADKASAAALWLAARHGWHVLPLHSRTKVPLPGCRSCRADNRDHAPGDCPCLARFDGALCHGVWAATANHAVLTGWARQRRFTVWAVHCGVSGLLAVDLDAHGGTPPAQPLNGRPWPTGDPLPVDGLDTYATLASLAGAVLDIDTFATDTPSGGMHLLYATGTGQWKNSHGHARDGEDTVRTGLGWQIDIKAHGGYVVLPASVTATGTYRRASTTVTPALLPGWLARELTRTGHDRTATPTASIAAGVKRPPPVAANTPASPTRYAMSALRSACVELAAMAPNTGRNAKLFRSASRLAGMVAAQWIDHDLVTAHLADAASRCGLPAGEIRYAITSGFTRPRPAPEIRSGA